MTQNKNSTFSDERNPRFPRNDLTVEFVRSILDYDPDTGMLRWRVNRGQRARSGSIAGSKHSSGYRYISINYCSYKAHRIAWLMAYGRWPTKQIDHINGIRSDNRIANLREATSGENLQNQKLEKISNKIGILGVHISRGKYRAQIQVNGKVRHLGMFETAEEASAAYRASKRVLHPTWVED